MSAPLRINKFRPPREEPRSAFPLPKSGGTPPESQRPTQMQAYFDRLVKLIPAEVVAIYLVGIGIIPADQKPAFAIWAAVCFCLVIVARAYATSDRENNIPPQWPAVIISAISFVIWAYTMPGAFQVYGLAVGYIGSLLVLVWTFLVPYIYRGS